MTGGHDSGGTPPGPAGPVDFSELGIAIDMMRLKLVPRTHSADVAYGLWTGRAPVENVERVSDRPYPADMRIALLAPTPADTPLRAPMRAVRSLLATMTRAERSLLAMMSAER